MRRLKRHSLFARSSATIRRVRVSIGLNALFSLSSLCAAQVDRGGLIGTVSDPSGMRLAETHIMAEQTSTQPRRETISDPTGNYDFAELPVGTCTVTFKHSGFQTLKLVDAVQEIGRKNTLDTMLKVSGGVEMVEVSVGSVLERDREPHDTRAGGAGKQTLIYRRQAP